MACKKSELNWTEKEKQKLATEAEKYPAIWDLTNANHQNSSFMESSWKSISKEMGKPVEECKSAWRSLRDSLTYIKKNKEKSGSSLNDEQFEVEEFPEDVDFNLSSSLAYLESANLKRRIHSTSVSEEEDSVHSVSSGSSYSFHNKRKNNNEVDVTLELLSSIKNYINKKQSNELKYQTMWANLDTLAAKLSEDDVIELNVQFVNAIYNKIQDNKNKEV